MWSRFSVTVRHQPQSSATTERKTRTSIASEVVRFELLAGVRDREVEALELFFSALSWVPVGEEVARSVAALAREHRRAQQRNRRGRLPDRRDGAASRRRAADDERSSLPDA
jgi:predicted nucleic acid-binding protein